MNRPAAGSVLTTLLIFALAVPVLASGYSYADDFGSGGYKGSTGSESWAAPWTEVGESNGPGSGSVTVSNSALCTLNPCLVVQGLIGVTNLGAWRRLELDPGDSAEMRYDIDFPGGALVQGSALVQASADGRGWQTVSTHTPGAHGTFRVSLPAASSTIDVRFVTSGLSLLGSMAIDSVVVNVVPAPTTTSTTAATTTTSSSIAVTLPTTPTLPSTSLTLPTATLPSSTTTTTTTTTGRPTTTALQGSNGPTTSAPNRTTTTLDQTRTADAPTSTSTTVREERRLDTSIPSPGSPPSPPPPPSHTSGVLTRLDPGLRGGGSFAIQAQENLAVRFVRASEHLGFDILANLLLGIVLAWASVARLERRRRMSAPATTAG